MTEKQLEAAKDNRREAREYKSLFDTFNDGTNEVAFWIKSGVSAGTLTIPSPIRRAIAEAAKKRLDELDAEFERL